MTAWAQSRGYGAAVALGPTQQAVYAFVVEATRGGRRPEFTLATIATRTGKPVSSVHDALGRLRALGLIGCAARMGRTGAHRLWRVGSAVMGALDPARHRRAVARIMRRWPTLSAAAASGTPPPDAPRPTEGQPGTRPSVAIHEGSAQRPRPTLAGGTIDSPAGPSDFDGAMRRYGFRPWWDTREGTLPDGNDDHGRATPNVEGRDGDTLGLVPSDVGDTT